MKLSLAIAALAAGLIFAAPTVNAQQRLTDGVLGAGAGALVGGPIGAAAGGVIGYTQGPRIGRAIDGRGYRGHRRHRSYAYHGHRRYYR